MNSIFKMQHCILALLLISNYTFSHNPESGKTSLSGIIREKGTNTTLPGVVLYIPDLKTGTISKEDGSYFIDNLPSKSILIQISLVGYKTVVETIDLKQFQKKDFELEVAVKEINEIVVTGHSQAEEKNKIPTPISSISQTQLLQNSSANIIDALATQPGISQITTGSGISKPVIRGLGYNRVVVVNDGIRQEGQQWGDEHGIEIDEFSANKIEILKGPASLSYGSDAIAGVINIMSAPPLPEGNVKGSALMNYQTNNGLMAYSANIAGNLKGFIWDIRYSNKMAHAYKNKLDGYVYNSGFKENAITGTIGTNKSWGYTHLNFSLYEMMPGIVEGDRDSLTGNFTKPLVVNDSTLSDEIVSNKDLKSYTPSVAFQKINHYKLSLSNSFVLKKGYLKAIVGVQQNHRKEFSNPFHPDDYELYFLLNTLTYDLRYVYSENNFNVSLGINGMQQTSKNLGEEFLVPEYNLFDIGGFVTTTKTYKKLTVSGGVRYDQRTQSSKELFTDANGNRIDIIDSSSVQQFTAFKKQFGGVSGSIGAAYNFSETFYTKLNIARGYRAPNIAELGSNGIHEGTLRYEIGNNNLKPEYSLQYDFALGINTEHITAELNLFYSSIANYIYLQKINTSNGLDSIREGYQTFQFVQGNAQLLGGEFSFDIHPHPFDWLHFENTFSLVQAKQLNQPDSTKYLPLIPAPKLVSEIRMDIKKSGKTMRNLYAKFQLENYLEQNKIYTANNTETQTPAYTLLNIGLGSDVVNKKEKTICSIYVSANNLTDVAYQNHLSRLKYAPENYATSRTGIYNMGRNFSFKLLIPINIKA